MTEIFTLLPPAELAAFLAASIVLNLTPGADVMFATASGLQGGARAGVVAGLGVGLGVLFHLTLATVGLGAIAAEYPQVLTAVKYLGAAYLLLLAWQSWNAEPHAPTTRTPESAWCIARRGALSNILNPKPVLFLLAFLPQFTKVEYGPIWQQILGLGLIFTFTGTLITMAYGIVAGFLGMRLSKHMGVLNRISAVIFAGLAVRLVVK